jgi:hypothetical protein
MIMVATMPLTRSFKDLVQRHVAEEPAYAEGLLREGRQDDHWRHGRWQGNPARLIKATIGLRARSRSLIRMFGPRGNPQARNLFSVIGYLQKRAGLELCDGGVGMRIGAITHPSAKYIKLLAGIIKREY